MATMIPVGYSYNRKTGEYTDLYRAGTAEDLAEFALRFYGLYKIVEQKEADDD